MKRRRRWQKIRFWFYFWRRFAASLPFAAVLPSLYRRGALGRYKGIIICDTSFNRRRCGEQFHHDTIEALKLIEQIDPRRFRRVQREVRFIVHAEYTSSACYSRIGRICEVDYGKYEFNRDHQWYLHCYASTLIHEATHGALYSRAIACTARTRCRIERICHTESRRFLKRLDTPEMSWSERIAGPFDERRWFDSWHSNWFSKKLRFLKRIRQARKEAADS